MAKKHQYTADDVDTLARTIWGEARGEGYNGMLGVANVAVNRFLIAEKKPALQEIFGKTLISAMKGDEGARFNCWKSDSKDPQVKQNYRETINVTTDDKKFVQAREIAYGVLTGQLPDNTNGADHFYNPGSSNPAWKNDGEQTAKIGGHRFRNVYGVDPEPLRNFSDYIDMGSEPIEGTNLFNRPRSIEDITALADAQNMVITAEGLQMPESQIIPSTFVNATPDIGLDLALSDITKSAAPETPPPLPRARPNIESANANDVAATQPKQPVAGIVLPKIMPADFMPLSKGLTDAASLESVMARAPVVAMDTDMKDVNYNDIAAFRHKEEKTISAAQAFSENYVEMTMERGDSVSAFALENGVPKNKAELEKYFEKFEELNPGVKASKISEGVTYKMPAFEKTVASEDISTGMGKGSLAKVFNPADAAIEVPSQKYKVQKGDSLTKIADRLFPGNDDRADAEMAKEIAKTNNIQNPNMIREGQSLILPGASPS